MANVGTAHMNIVPKFDGLTHSVKKAFGGVDTAGVGHQMGLGVSNGVSKGLGGLVRSGALIGVFSSLTSKAMDVMRDHVGAAAARIDTLKNYPKVMEALNVSSEEASSSIKTMSDRLMNLPTRLDTMASTVQGLYAATKDYGVSLTKATLAGLGLNDMLLAGGQGTEVVNSAMEQFRQMLSKGKPDMQDWKSLLAAAPGQMDQLAKAMLGPTANANDLYAALGGGKNKPTLSMEQLLDAIIKLDHEGGAGVQSFQKQAEVATAGIKTSVDNTFNAITKGIANTFDQIGRENIVVGLNFIKAGINQAFDTLNTAIPGIKKTLGELLPIVIKIGPPLVAAGLAFKTFSAASAALKTAGIFSLGDAFAYVSLQSGALAGKIGALALSISPFAVAAAVAAGGIALLVGAYQDAKKHAETMDKATRGLTDATKASVRGISDATASLDGFGRKAQGTKVDIDAVIESQGKLAEAIQKRNEEAEVSVGRLSGASQVLHEYLNRSNLSAQQQGQLCDAIKLVNDQCGTQYKVVDAVNGKIADESGKILESCESIDAYIQKKKEQIRVDALSANLGDLYKQQSKDIQAVATASKDLDAAKEKLSGVTHYRTVRGQQIETKEWRDASAAIVDAQKKYDDANATLEANREAINRTNEALGNVTKVAEGAADSVAAFAGASAEISETFKVTGQDVGVFGKQLENLGVTTEQFANLTPQQLQTLANSYDGSSESIVRALQSIGNESLNLQTLLEDAGVSTETLNAVGSDNLSALAESCNYNMGLMVYYLQHYNDTPIIDKDGNITVNQAELVDAQGNVYTWNGTQLLDKDGNAIVDDRSLSDAQGNIYTWNNSTLKHQKQEAVVTGNLKDSIAQRDDWNKGNLQNKSATARIDIFKSITEFVTGKSHNAAGGVRLHADGGAIYTKATYITPHDIIGEDGAEYYDGTHIVPLTNRHYSQPFADVIAEGVIGRMSGVTTSDIYSAVAAALSAVMPDVIHDNTPVMGQRQFSTAVRRSIYA